MHLPIIDVQLGITGRLVVSAPQLCNKSRRKSQSRAHAHACNTGEPSDEYLLQADLEKVLTDAGFATEIVSSGEEALTLFIGGSITCQALVTDVRLRGSLSGWEVARQIREKEPAFPVIYVTTAPAEEWPRTAFLIVSSYRSPSR